MDRKLLTVVGLVSFLILPLIVPSTTVAKSTLILKSNPSGASVARAGERVGTTPISLEIGVEKTNVSLTGDGFDWLSSVRANGDMNMTVNLSSTAEDPPHRMLVLSEPEKAKVVVDGKLRGRTPWTGSLEPGEHTVKLRKEGFGTWSATLDVRSGLSLTGKLRTVTKSTGDDSKQSSGAVQSRANGEKHVEPVQEDDRVKLVMPLGKDKQEDESWGLERQTDDVKEQSKETDSGTSTRAETAPAERKAKKDKTTAKTAETKMAQAENGDTQPETKGETQADTTGEASKESIADTADEATKKAEADTETRMDTRTKHDTEPAMAKETEKDTKPEEPAERTAEEKKRAEKQALAERKERQKTPSSIPFSIESTPAEARLLVDGETVGKTPYVKKDFSSGTTTIQLRKNGFRDWKETFFLDEPTQLNVNMKPIWSYLTVHPNPESMTVAIAGREFELDGKRTFKMQPGEYDIRGSAPRIGSTTSSVSLTKGETESLDLTLEFEPQAWEFPTTRDVFLRMAQDNLDQLVSDFGIGAGQRLEVIPEYQDWAHNLMDDVLSVVMNRNAILVVDNPSSREADGALDHEFKFYIVEMDVQYEEDGKMAGVKWVKRHFDLKIHAKLIRHETGEVQFTKFFRHTTTDRIPASLKRELRTPYEPPQTEPPLE